MILPVIVITIATAVTSKTTVNESSLAVSTSLSDDGVNDSDDSIEIPDVEQENICKRVVVFNSTRVITFRVERRLKCKLSTQNCNEDGYERKSSVGFMNLTETQRVSENVCCDGYKNESGKCVRDFPNSTTNVTSDFPSSTTNVTSDFPSSTTNATSDLPSSTINKTSDKKERGVIEDTTVLMIVLPVVGAVIVLVIFAVVIYKIKHSKKRPRDRPSYAHENPVYDSTLGQSNIIVHNTCLDNEQWNREAGAASTTNCK